MATSTSQTTEDAYKLELGSFVRFIQDKDQNTSQIVNKQPEENKNWLFTLYKAALRGDWETARKIFDKYPEALTTNKITFELKLVLLAALGKREGINFLKEFLKLIPSEILPTWKDEDDCTILHFAANVGNIEAAELLVGKNPVLPNSLNNEKELPLHIASFRGDKDMVSYLLTVTRNDIEPNPFTDKSGVVILANLLGSGFYDLARDLIQLYPKLATTSSPEGASALSIIAEFSLPFQGGSSTNVWERLIYSCIPVKFGNFYKQAAKEGSEDSASGSQVCPKNYCCPHVFRKFSFSVPCVKSIQRNKLMHQQRLELFRLLCMEFSKLDFYTATEFLKRPMMIGATLGNSAIVEEILKFCPFSYLLAVDGNTIFHIAVANRNENIFNLLHEISGFKELEVQRRDSKSNTILHLAGKLAPLSQLNLVSGAALQMQRELQWYKEVEKYVVPFMKHAKNSKGRTAAEEFSIEHKDLVKEGEKWMKDTANSCTVAAALIATITFAAAITVPGGNNGDTIAASGFPIFSKDTAFNMFAIFDALSLFSSVASLLVFLSILTARYAQDDFLFALPRSLILGLLTLFLSISSMMVAFSATIYLVFGHRKAWTIVPIAILACLPVTLFVTLQFPLLLDMIRSTYYPGLFSKRRKR